MRVALFLFVAAGCASADPSYDLLSPVKPPEPTAAPISTSVPEDFTISSEELRQNSAASRGEDRTPLSPFGGTLTPAEPPDAEAVAEAETPSAETVGTEPVAEAAPAETPAATPAPVTAPTSAASPWPVRLVKTVPEAQPPRAILALPDGKELVVTPGAVLAEQSLVVMGIGRGTMELAKIRPAGDHAEISPITLTAQY